MTRTTRTYGKVALLMAGILAASVLLTLAVGVDRRPAGKTRIVASFYPVYIAVLNLTAGVDGVEVVSLTGPTTGCLHDYQLSPDNRITLSGRVPAGRQRRGGGILPGQRSGPNP